ncbi:MAG: DUF1153 domain-containing protein [Dehalococcoidia bacterium]|nr:DUF1153 domain-containing protein [Dehalococcoidia bacterium]
MQEQIPENVQRWTAKRRAALILGIVKGETSAQEAARAHGLTVAEVEDWKERYLAAAGSVPQPRSYSCMVFDQATGKVILFGGLMVRSRSTTPGPTTLWPTPGPTCNRPGVCRLRLWSTPWCMTHLLAR